MFVGLSTIYILTVIYSTESKTGDVNVRIDDTPI